MNTAPSPEPLEPDAAPTALAILRADGSSRLVAQRPLEMGEVVLVLDGVLVDRPSRHSIQVDMALHLEKPAGVAGVAELDQCLWRFLEHSCEPNAAFRGRQLIATRRIAAFEPVT
ncbi:MAG: hypothetical protein ACO4CZ_06860, partial [Planctomycetota bacterium]